jgi:hypothetical protein
MLVLRARNHTDNPWLSAALREFVSKTHGQPDSVSRIICYDILDKQPHNQIFAQIIVEALAWDEKIAFAKEDAIDKIDGEVKDSVAYWDKILALAKDIISLFNNSYPHVHVYIVLGKLIQRPSRPDDASLQSLQQTMVNLGHMIQNTSNIKVCLLDGDSSLKKLLPSLCSTIEGLKVQFREEICGKDGGDDPAAACAATQN